MSDSSGNETCPLTQKELIEKYFMQHRCFLLDVASFLDRLDRARVKDAENDFRYTTFKRCLEALAEEDSNRTQKLLMLLSDPRTDLLEERDKQNAEGASPHAAGDQV
jgi:hypothetical protein